MLEIKAATFYTLLRHAVSCHLCEKKVIYEFDGTSECERESSGKVSYYSLIWRNYLRNKTEIRKTRFANHRINSFVFF